MSVGAALTLRLVAVVAVVAVGVWRKVPIRREELDSGVVQKLFQLPVVGRERPLCPFVAFFIAHTWSPFFKAD